MKNLIFLLVLIILISCKDDSGDVFIRVKNVSQYNYQGVVVGDGGDLRAFGNLSTGKATEYQKFESAYRYAYVELEIEGETFYVQPIDFVGEELLNPGDYTYEIGADNSADTYGRLTLELSKD